VPTGAELSVAAFTVTDEALLFAASIFMAADEAAAGLEERAAVGARRSSPAKTALATSAETAIGLPYFSISMLVYRIVV
jgi:hypothetical protein